MKLLEAYDNGTDAEREALMKLVGKERLKMLVNELKTENWKYEGLSVVHLHDKIKVYFY